MRIRLTVIFKIHFLSNVSLKRVMRSVFLLLSCFLSPFCFWQIRWRDSNLCGMTIVYTNSIQHFPLPLTCIRYFLLVLFLMLPKPIVASIFYEHKIITTSFCFKCSNFLCVQFYERGHFDQFSLFTREFSELCLLHLYIYVTTKNDDNMNIFYYINILLNM